MEDWKVGRRFDFGMTVLSEQDIIDFAKQFDPLDCHTAKEAAEKHFFKGLVASGPHIFNLVHRTRWIPILGHTVICGKEVTDWKFIRPIYAGQKVFSSATITDVKFNKEKNYVEVTWLYEFLNEKGEPFQTL